MSLKTFFRNIKWLYRNDISKNILEYPYCELSFDALLEELRLELPQRKNSYKIKDIYETIDDIIVYKASLCRFGDGELNLVKGKSIPFQTASKKLSERLTEVLSSKKDNVFVGIPRILFHSKQNVMELQRNFILRFGEQFKKIMVPYLDKEHVYYPTDVTMPLDMYIEFDVEKYFNRIQKIWEGRDVTMVCGEGVFRKIEHNIFDCANSLDFVYAPSMNAFDVYDDILKKCLEIDKSRLVIAILGPTATVLAYDLALAGYQALDMGHIAKAYDWWIKGKSTKEMKDAVDFFAPDL